MIRVTNPQRWLLEQLPAYVPAEQLAELLGRLEEQKQRYRRATEANALQRRIRNAANWPKSTAKTEQIARWEAKLAALQAELQAGEKERTV